MQPIKKRKSRWRLKEDSLSKCWVIFTDGNTFSRYSRDWLHETSPARNGELGLARLRKMITKMGAKARQARIYDLSTGKELERYYYGIKSLNQHDHENS